MPDTNHLTRRERLEEREETIIAAAHAEFVANGFEGAKIAAIAGRAGVAEGTLYLYFRNKNALLGAVVGAFYARLTEGALAGVAARDTTQDRLAFLAHHHLRCCFEEWSILMLAMPVLHQSGRYRDSEYFGFNRTYVTVFDSVIREGIARGDVRGDLPLHMMRDLFYGTLEHSVRTVMVRAAGVPGVAEIEEMRDQVMAMVQAAYGIGPRTRTEDAKVGLCDVARRLDAAVRRLEEISPQR